MATKATALTAEDTAVDECLGYPKAFVKLCRSHGVAGSGLYVRGPPSCFLPYGLQPQEALRAKELNEMFPVIDPEAIPSVNPRGFVNLLWKQLDHLGNAGFDPDLFRVDVYGNVLYLHADSASPLAWDIDHWFPCARGGKTAPSNLRILQSQVCKRKQNKLEFLIPWWDLQLGISVNQFLSIFASKNSDFRNRAFSFLFADGACEELNSLQTVDAHAFPQHFADLTKKVGLAPAAIVSFRGGGSDSSVLRPLDANRSGRPSYPIIAAIKPTFKRDENFCPENAHGSDAESYNVAMAVNSLRQTQEAKKKQAETNELDSELSELKQKNEADRTAIQDLEALLIKRKRRVEKCRRLAEAQSSYKSVLEKMIRDAMHQSVVYKEQLRLNQAATSALMARLEAQRAICDSSEIELCRKMQQRDDLKKQINPLYDQATRKRLRTGGEASLIRPSTLSVSGRPGRRRGYTKELRTLLEEEQVAYETEAGLHVRDENDALQSRDTDEDESPGVLDYSKNSKSSTQRNDFELIGRSREVSQFTTDDADEIERTEDADEDEDTLKKSSLPCKHDDSHYSSRRSRNRNLIHASYGSMHSSDQLPSAKISLLRKSSSLPQTPRREDDEQVKKIGKGNVDKWLHMLIENSGDGGCAADIRNDDDDEIVEVEGDEPANDTGEMAAGRKSFEAGKQWLPRSDSSRRFRSLPSSPSMIFGIKKGGDCIGRKPKVLEEDDDAVDNCNVAASSSGSKKFIKRCTKAIKNAVNNTNNGR